jgi:hypothetical protein
MNEVTFEPPADGDRYVACRRCGYTYHRTRLIDGLCDHCDRVTTRPQIEMQLGPLAMHPPKGNRITILTAKPQRQPPPPADAPNVISLDRARQRRWQTRRDLGA